MLKLLQIYSAMLEMLYVKLLDVFECVYGFIYFYTLSLSLSLCVCVCVCVCVREREREREIGYLYLEFVLKFVQF